MRPFLGLAPSKLKLKKKEINGSICAYRVFYPPIFRRIEGGGVEFTPHPPRFLRYRKKRGPERVKNTYISPILILVYVANFINY